MTATTESHHNPRLLSRRLRSSEGVIVESFSVRREPGRVAVAGELDLAAAPQLADALASFDGEGPVTVDLAETTFVDSRGLATLVAAHHRLGGQLRVVNVRPEVRRVFEITKLDDVLLRDA